MHRIYLSLGSNLGDRRKNLRNAFDMLQEQCGRIFAASSLYETEPWGFVHENPFYNQVIGLLSPFDPATMHENIRKMEKALGRTGEKRNHRDQTGYSARIIDIDLLFWDDLVIDTPGLKIPHPCIPGRRFVLMPMAEIAPDLMHPVLQQTTNAMLEACEDKGWIRKLQE